MPPTFVSVSCRVSCRLSSQPPAGHSSMQTGRAAQADQCIWKREIGASRAELNVIFSVFGLQDVPEAERIARLAQIAVEFRNLRASVNSLPMFRSAAAAGAGRVGRRNFEGAGELRSRRELLPSARDRHQLPGRRRSELSSRMVGKSRIS